MGNWQKNAARVNSTSVPFLYTVGPSSRASENRLGNTRHLASECLKRSRAQKPFQQKDFFSLSSELEHGFPESEPVQCATELLEADNTSLFFFNINCNYHLRALCTVQKVGNVDNAACPKSAAKLIACHEGPRFWMAPQHMVGSLARPKFACSDYHCPAYWPCFAVQRHDALAKCSRAAKHCPKQPKQHHDRRLETPS